MYCNWHSAINRKEQIFLFAIFMCNGFLFLNFIHVCLCYRCMLGFICRDRDRILYLWVCWISSGLFRLSVRSARQSGNYVSRRKECVSELFRFRGERARRAPQNNSQTQGRISRLLNTLKESLRRRRHSMKLWNTLSESAKRELRKYECTQNQHIMECWRHWENSQSY